MTFDCALTMRDGVEELVRECQWKIRSITKTGQFFIDAHTIHLYKAHVLSFIENRAAAIYHATGAILGPLDKLQRRFISNLGITIEEAFIAFNFASLEARRDMAMLGLIHRAAVGQGPIQLQTRFPPARHDDDRC